MNVIGFNHITLNVKNLEESLSFYEGILGMKRIHQGQTDAYLEWGTAWICLLEKESARFSNHPVTGVDHFAFSIAEDDFLKAVTILNHHSVQIVRGPIERGGGKVVNFLDPNGIQIELNTSDLRTRMKDWR